MSLNSTEPAKKIPTDLNDFLILDHFENLVRFFLDPSFPRSHLPDLRFATRGKKISKPVVFFRIVLSNLMFEISMEKAKVEGHSDNYPVDSSGFRLYHKNVRNC